MAGVVTGAPGGASLPPRSRGVIGLLEENCTVCMLCARECPDWCIYIESHKETVPPPGGSGVGTAPGGGAAWAAGSAAAGPAGTAGLAGAAGAGPDGGVAPGEGPATGARRAPDRGSAPGGGVAPDDGVAPDGGSASGGGVGPGGGGAPDGGAVAGGGPATGGRPAPGGAGAPSQGAAPGRARVRNVLDRFAIDFSLCMYCGICVEVCPYDALFWSPEYAYPEAGIAGLTHERDRLREWMWTVPPPPAHDPGAPVPREVPPDGRETGPG
jgi:NAD-dependent dihydropyrimidine dehydrogenase PreA subunit